MANPVYNDWPPEVWALATSGYNEITKRMIREASDMPRENRLIKAAAFFNAEPNVGDDADYVRMLAMAHALPDEALERMVASFDIPSDEVARKMKERLRKSAAKVVRYIRELKENPYWFKFQKSSLSSQR